VPSPTPSAARGLGSRPGTFVQAAVLRANGRADRNQTRPLILEAKRRQRWHAHQPPISPMGSKARASPSARSSSPNMHARIGPQTKLCRPSARCPTKSSARSPRSSMLSAKAIGGRPAEPEAEQHREAVRTARGVDNNQIERTGRAASPEQLDYCKPPTACKSVKIE
jgi:hypothetical protein